MGESVGLISTLVMVSSLRKTDKMSLYITVLFPPMKKAGEDYSGG